VSLLQTVIQELKSKARPDQLEGMGRFGMQTEKRLGVAIPELRKMAKNLGKNHDLALGLWREGLAESRILAAMVDEAEKLTERQMDDWVKDFDSWDVCDQVCMNLFEKTPLAWKKIRDWSKRQEEFVKRAAFALIACLAWHDRNAGDEKFTALFPVIRAGSTDERNFVKKAANWAIRNIGKRNRNLNRAALAAAEEIRQLDSKAARWISSNAIRELESDAVQKRLLVREKSPTRQL
jgi:3-methyladenine DNA glycosylase AlkD